MKERIGKLLAALFVLAATAVLVLFLYRFDWSGFGPHSFEQAVVTQTLSDSSQQVTYTTHSKTLWDWLELLIVPAVLAGGAILFNRQVAKREEVGKEDRYREEALQRYFDVMSDLLLEHDLREELDKLPLNRDALSSVVDVARVRTVVVLSRMDQRRRNEVLNFLRRAELITGSNSLLSHATLSNVDLSKADLHEVNLTGAVLVRANLCDADLGDANLSAAELYKANLRGADLTNSTLVGAVVSIDQLEKTYSLDGAIMMDGRRYTG